MNCQDNSRLKVPLPEACRTADIGCVPISNGKPKCPPEPDQLPLAYDPNSKTIWIFDCDSRDWNAYTRFSLSELGEVSLDNFRDVCNMLKVPVFYNPGTGTIEGHMTLADFGEKLKECLNLPGTDSKSVVKAGSNVNVTSSTSGSTTTYVVSATGGGDEDSKTVIEAGDNITLTSSKSGATTTYKISSTGAGPGDSKTVLTEGTNIKLTKTESGATTTYKIDCTADGSDGNDVTVVEAGSNVNVASSKSGNITTYTVSATGGGPNDSKTILQGKDGGNVIVTSTTSGATTTYTLDSKDSKSVVKAGTGISVTSATSGDTTTYTVTNTGGSGGGGDGNDITKVVAGENVTVTSATSGNTTTYTVNSTGGGPQDSKTVVAAGTGIDVKSSTSGAVTTYTVSSTGEGGGGSDAEGSVARLFTNVGGGCCIEILTDENLVVYQARDRTIIQGNGEVVQGGSSIAEFTVVNPFSVPSLVEFDVYFTVSIGHWSSAVAGQPAQGINVLLNVSDTRDKSYDVVYGSSTLTSNVDESTVAIPVTTQRNPGGSIDTFHALRHSAVLAANESKKFYVNYWVRVISIYGIRVVFHATTKGTATIFRNHKAV